MTPYTFTDPSQFRSNGPNSLTSSAYTEDFIETRDFGRKNSTFRSTEQTETVYFWTGVNWNRNLIELAITNNLNLRETARFFAMVHTAAADAAIAGFNTKYFYRAWRPRTAIPRADTDGNPDTTADPSWIPELSVNHPEYPSAHAFVSNALIDTVAAYFGTHKVTWRIGTSRAAFPPVLQCPPNVENQCYRTYTDLNALLREIDDARVYAGLHWRHSMRHGVQIGRNVSRHVVENYFQPGNR
jgi:hypothetical protein